MTNAKVIRTIIGIIGNVLSTLISLSKMPAFIEIYKRKSVEEYIPYGHVLLVMKRSLWVSYGLSLVSKDNILVTTSNGIGLALEVFYVLVFFIYCGDQKRRRNTFFLLCHVLILVGIFYVISLYGLTLESFSHRQTFVGVVCNILTQIIDVIIAICSDVPVWFSLTGFINAGIWIAYSSISKVDIYILISNCLGLLLCATQFLCYYACVHPTPDVNVAAV